MPKIAFHIAGLDFEAHLSRAPKELWGTYLESPPVGPRAHVVLQIEVIDDFGEGEEDGPNHPGFETLDYSENALVVARRGCRGRFVWEPDGRLLGDFQVHDSPSSVEAALRIAAALTLPTRECLLLHASAVRWAGEVQVFAGRSGAGKSTISTLLNSLAGVEKVADELLLLNKQRGQWRVQLPPFRGSEELPRDLDHPLRAINLLEQAPEHSRSPLAPTQAMSELVSHTVNFARAPRLTGAILELLVDLVSSTPCYRLEFAKEPSVSEVLGITCSPEGTPIPWREGDGRT